MLHSKLNSSKSQPFVTFKVCIFTLIAPVLGYKFPSLLLDHLPRRLFSARHYAKDTPNGYSFTKLQWQLYLMPKLVNKLNGTQFNVMQIWLENSNRAPKEFNFYWIWFPLFHTKPPLLMRIWLHHFHLPDWSPHRWTQSFCTLLTTHHSRKQWEERKESFFCLGHEKFRVLLVVVW